MLKQKLKIRQPDFFPFSFKESTKGALRILSDLGRPTKRGIKKCYKCGTYNGTRSLMCKNLRCASIFKSCVEKERSNLDAVKLISGTSRRVFSVRVRGKGPEYRGFVQLPLVECIGTQEADAGLCFVDSCQRLFDDSILKCHETQESNVVSICAHIESAWKSVRIAVPIDAKTCLLNFFNFTADVKQKLWLLSTETKGALVQRISKSVMAVKCQVSPKHPLGYLHFTFCVSKTNKLVYDKFFCSCLNYKGVQDYTKNQKCIHFYACVWAFASDVLFTNEFAEFLSIELGIGKPKTNLKCNLIRNINRTHVKLPSPQVKLEVFSRSKKYEETLQQINLKIINVPAHFIDWLTSVTEKINQRLLKNKKECVEKLAFYIPTRFFVLLQGRMHSDRGFENFCVVKQPSNLTYFVFNLPFVKRIFDTPQVSLQLVQFSKNSDDVFPKEQVKVSFLKVGLEKATDCGFSSFAIYWSSNVLPISNFGKLELTFYVGFCNDGELKSIF